MRQLARVATREGHYKFDKYVSIGRWCSYYHQINYAAQVPINAKIAVIGPGDGLVPKILKELREDVEIVTIDCDTKRKPDVCADVRDLAEHVVGEFDAILCCEVLEHIPFDDFECSLGSIKNVLKDGGVLILSLPDSGVSFKIEIMIKVCLTLVLKVPRIWKRKFSSREHFWEINAAKPYRVSFVRKMIKEKFVIVREFNVSQMVGHRFFICKKVN